MDGIAQAPPPDARASACECVRAARTIIAAARRLSRAGEIAVDRAWCRHVAGRMEAALAKPEVRRADLLAASPSVFQRDGRLQTLVQMIEAEPGDDADRLGLTALLLRAIEWRR